MPVDDASVSISIKGDNSQFLNSLTQSVNAMRKAQQDMLTNGGQSSSYAALQQRINTTLALSQQKYREMQEAAKGAETNVSRGKEAFKSFSQVLSGAGLSSLTAYAGGAYAAGKAIQWTVGAVKDAMKTYNNFGDSLYRLKLSTGDTTEQVSALKFAAEAVGVSSLSLEMRWAQFSKALVSNNKWVRALGIEYKNLDGSTKSAFKLMGETADKLNTMSDSEKREAVAMGLFGRGFKDILPLLAQGSAGLERMQKIAKERGLIWSDKDLSNQRNYYMATKQLGAAFTGLKVTIASALAPILARVFEIIAKGVSWFVNLWKSSEVFRNSLKTTVAVLFGIMNPILGVIMVLATLVKHFDWVGSTISTVFGAIGSIAGKGASVLIKVLKNMLDATVIFAQGFLKAGEIVTGNRFWKAIFGSGAHDAISGALETMSSFKHGMDQIMNTASDAAWKYGGNWGKNFGNGLVGFLKNFKLPRIGGSQNLGWAEGGEYDPSMDLAKAGGGGGGGKSRNKLLDYFTKLVEQSRSVLNALIDKAKETKKQMDDMSKSVSESLTKAFSITDAAEGGFGSAKGLVRVFQRRLADMRAFVGNIRKLRDLGLPAEMMADLVNAGVSGGAQIAKMLVADPSAIAELSNLTAQARMEAGAAGEMVSGAMFGAQLASDIGAANAAQGQFSQLLNSGNRFGYSMSEADVNAATQNIYNMTMGVNSNADPATIQQAIAWALKTGGMMGRGGGGGGRPAAGGGYGPQPWAGPGQWSGAVSPNRFGSFGPEYGYGGYGAPAPRFGAFGPEYGYSGWGGSNGLQGAQYGASPASSLFFGASRGGGNP